MFANKILAFLFLLIGVSCTSGLHREKKTTVQADIRKFLSVLPSEERFLLEFFFRCLIQEDAVGYVLLDGKPMSFYSYLKPKTMINSTQVQPLDRMELFFAGMDDRDTLFHKGLEIWKKYEHFFCGRNIFFDVFEQDETLHFMQVSVFNKRLMLPLIERHFHKFMTLDESVEDGESLFDLLLHDQKFKEMFYRREHLVGICLGYGEKNAELFQRMVSLHTTLGRLGFTLEQPAPDRLRSLEEELASLEKSFTGGIHTPVSRKLFFNIGLGFRADFTDPETLFLQKKYSKLHKRLTQAYEGTGFLEKTLGLICAADRVES